MPQLFKVGRFVVYFWSNEGMPEEPVHVHISEGAPSPNATKIWITKSGRTLAANNNSHIREKELRILQKVIEANSRDIVKEWSKHFETLSYYC